MGRRRSAAPEKRTREPSIADAMVVLEWVSGRFIEDPKPVIAPGFDPF